VIYSKPELFENVQKATEKVVGLSEILRDLLFLIRLFRLSVLIIYQAKHYCERRRLCLNINLVDTTRTVALYFK